MEAQVKPKQVFENVASYAANSLLCDACKYRISNFLKDSCADPSGSICDYHGSSHGPSGTTKGSKVHIHRVDNVFEIKRNLHIQDLRSD